MTREEFAEHARISVKAMEESAKREADAAFETMLIDLHEREPETRRIIEELNLRALIREMYTGGYVDGAMSAAKAAIMEKLRAGA